MVRDDLNKKENFLIQKKDVLFFLYKEKVEDYRQIDNKIAQFIILNTALITISINYVKITKNPYGIFLYLLSFSLIFISMGIMVFAYVPKLTYGLNPSKIVKEYDDHKDSDKLLKRVSDEIGNSRNNLDGTMNKKVFKLKVSLVLLILGLLLLFSYNIIFHLS